MALPGRFRPALRLPRPPLAIPATAAAKTTKRRYWPAWTSSGSALTAPPQRRGHSNPDRASSSRCRDEERPAEKVASDACPHDLYMAVGEGSQGLRRETAGCLNGGRAVWCLARLDEPIELPGDASLTMPYLAITNRHDGSGACALRATAVRIVCANTFRAAELEGERHGATFSFIHRASWHDRIGEARDAVTGARRELRAYRQLAQELLRGPITARSASCGCGSSCRCRPMVWSRTG